MEHSIACSVLGFCSYCQKHAKCVASSKTVRFVWGTTQTFTIFDFLINWNCLLLWFYQKYTQFALNIYAATALSIFDFRFKCFADAAESRQFMFIQRFIY